MNYDLEGNEPLVETKVHREYHKTGDFVEAKGIEEINGTVHSAHSVYRCLNIFILVDMPHCRKFCLIPQAYLVR